MTELAVIGYLLQELEKVKTKLLNSPPGLRRARHHRRPTWAGTASAGGVGQLLPWRPRRITGDWSYSLQNLDEDWIMRAVSAIVLLGSIPTI
jgi:hypothetical protein